MAQASSWLKERAELCRYASAPLAGLGPDGAVSVADVLFSRSLRQGGFVLWVSIMRDVGVVQPGSHFYDSHP